MQKAKVLPTRRWCAFTLATILFLALPLAAQQSAAEAWAIEADGLEQSILERLSPEQAEAFLEGADPATIVLADGSTLEEALLAGMIDSSAATYHPLDQCVVVHTIRAVGKFLDAEKRDYVVRGPATDLSAQGGNVDGCGVATDATAVVVNVKIQGGSRPGQAFVFPTGHASAPSVLNFQSSGLPPFHNMITLALGSVNDFSVKLTRGAHVIIHTVGYFSPGDGGGPTLGGLSCADGEVAKWNDPPGEWACGTAGGAVTDIWVDEAGDTMTGPLVMQSTAINLTGAWEIQENGDSFIHTRGGTVVGSRAFSNGTMYQISENVVMGLEALKDATAGNNNTVIGNKAMENSLGSGNLRTNTAVGSKTLQNHSWFGATALGYAALQNSTFAGQDTAVGASAMRYAGIVGATYGNTAVGYRALENATYATQNVAVGHLAMSNLGVAGTYSYNNIGIGSEVAGNLVGTENIALGWRTLHNNTGDRNIAIGRQAGYRVSGDQNIIIGYKAGWNSPFGDPFPGSSNILIGAPGNIADDKTIRIGDRFTHDETFVAGIRGKTTGYADAISVHIDSAGQLGTVSSSRRFKEDIRAMGRASTPLLDLRPVTFRYKKDFADGEKPIQFGLIAEEVAEVFPELVVYDEEGRPETVKYHLLATLLLNELQKQHGRAEVQAEQVAALRQRLAAVEEREQELLATQRRTEDQQRLLTALTARLARLEVAESGDQQVADRRRAPPN